MSGLNALKLVQAKRERARAHSMQGVKNSVPSWLSKSS